MTYSFKCDHCGKQIDLQRPVDERDQPVFCLHNNRKGEASIHKMRRLIAIPIINCHLEKDKPENDLGFILSGGSSSEKDKLDALKKDAKRAEKSESKRKDKPLPEQKMVTVDDILKTGLHPSMTKEQVQNWRAKNIPKDELAAP